MLSPMRCVVSVTVIAGHGVAQDWNKAVELYRQAAEADDPESQYLLARCYANGIGVRKNARQAAAWYAKAAEQEHDA